MFFFVLQVLPVLRRSPEGPGGFRDFADESVKFGSWWASGLPNSSRLGTSRSGYSPREAFRANFGMQRWQGAD